MISDCVPPNQKRGHRPPGLLPKASPCLLGIFIRQVFVERSAAAFERALSSYPGASFAALRRLRAGVV